MAAKSVMKRVGMSAMMEKDELRRIILVRNGETVDAAFGRTWTKFFDRNGNMKCAPAFSAANYVTFEDGNLPCSLLDRPEGMKHYEVDPPLTEVGKYSSMETGAAFGAAGLTASKFNGIIYCSPTCCCIETAHLLTLGLAKTTQDSKVQLCPEPGLMAQVGHDSRLDPQKMPKWLTREEIQTGLECRADEKYVPVVAEVTGVETMEAFYARMRKTVDYLISKTPQKSTLFIVGHAATLEGCSRTLYGSPLRRQRDLDSAIHLIPAVANLRLSERQPNKWEMSEPLLPPFTCAANDAYRWEVFGDPNQMRTVLKK